MATIRANGFAAAALTALAFSTVVSCGGGGSPAGPNSNCSANDSCPYTNVAPPPGGVAQFTVMPLVPGPGQSITALGNLNPPGHVLPTDHAYFYAGDLSKNTPFGTGTRNVYMPTTGAVMFLLQPTGTDWKTMFIVTNNFYFYFDHLLLNAPLTVGQIIPAGTLIGTTIPGGALDLGAFDLAVAHTGFANPARYGKSTLHVVSPWKYFTPALQQEIYAHVYRAPSAADKDGQIDFGVAGKLVGDWFQQGLPADQNSSGPNGWPRSIAFVYDYYDPSAVRISIGGTIGPPGVWAIEPTAVRPENVTPANGVVSYRLMYIDGVAQYGQMLVQMTDAQTIKVEMWVGQTVNNTAFDANAFTYVR